MARLPNWFMKVSDPAVFLGFPQNPEETAALLPSGIDVSDAGGVWLFPQKYGSWPPRAHVGVKEWATINALDPETRWDDALIMYCRKIADEYRRWGELRRKRRQKEEDYQLWLQRQQDERMADKQRREAEAAARKAAKQAAHKNAKERARQIYIARGEGTTLAVLGREFGITRERVRQIFLAEERRINKAIETLKAKQAAGDDSGLLTVEELELSVRAYNCVRNALGQKATVADIAERTEAEWLRNPNFGRKSLKELKEELARYGFTMGERRPGYFAAKTAFGRVLATLAALDTALAEFGEELDAGSEPEQTLDDLVERDA
jgi:Bacterial RNA polymerase, alpha chain C terminal domain